MQYARKALEESIADLRRKAEQTELACAREGFGDTMALVYDARLRLSEALRSIPVIEEPKPLIDPLDAVGRWLDARLGPNNSVERGHDIADLANLITSYVREEREACARLADIEKNACEHHLRATKAAGKRGINHQAGAQIARDIAHYIRARSKPQSPQPSEPDRDG